MLTPAFASQISIFVDAHRIQSGGHAHRVTVGTTGRHDRAASDRVPSSVCPFDRRFRHRYSPNCSTIGSTLEGTPTAHTTSVIDQISTIWKVARETSATKLCGSGLHPATSAACRDAPPSLDTPLPPPLWSSPLSIGAARRAFHPYCIRGAIDGRVIHHTAAERWRSTQGPSRGLFCCPERPLRLSPRCNTRPRRCHKETDPCPAR